MLLLTHTSCTASPLIGRERARLSVQRYNLLNSKTRYGVLFAPGPVTRTGSRQFSV